MPVGIVIANRRSHAKQVGAQAGFLRDVRERPVPVVSVKSMGERLWRMKEVRFPGVHKKDIHPAILVVVEDGDPWRNRFGKRALFRMRVDMHPSDSAFFPVLPRSDFSLPLQQRRC